jgi:hypothetical protein
MAECGDFAGIRIPSIGVSVAMKQGLLRIEQAAEF